MFMRAGVGTVCVLTCVLGGTTVARADEPGTSTPLIDDDRIAGPRLSTLWDRDAMMFLWAPLAGTVVINTYMPSRESPLMFSTSEGGETSLRNVEIPGKALTIGGALVAGSFLLGDDPARFQHSKGMAEALVVSGFAAVTIKRLVGRQRPDYDPMNPTEDGRRSFPSGHTTRAVSTITYAALYLRYHGFDQWREPGTLPWWELTTYAGLGALAIGLGGERVLHNRHHATDVLAGGLLGAASSALFFYYNEKKYRAGRGGGGGAVEGAGRPLADENADRPSLPAPGGPVVSFTGTF